MVQESILQRFVHHRFVPAVAVGVGHVRLIGAVLHRGFASLQRARLLLDLARGVDVDTGGDPPGAEEQRGEHGREREEHDGGRAADGLRRNLDDGDGGAHALEHEDGEEEEADRDRERDVRAHFHDLGVILGRIGVTLEVISHVCSYVRGDLVRADDAGFHVQVQRA